MAYKVEAVEAMKRKEGHDEAVELLKRIAKQVEPIMEKRKWRVGKLVEFFPNNPGLLGMNVNRGQKILIRLRHNSSPSTFMEVERLLDTMLHELVHNEIGPHSDKFYDMLEELRKECDSLMTGRNGFNVFASTHVPFEGQGSVLGGSAPLGLNRADAKSLREEMAKAAEKRAQRGRIMGVSGQKLGGSQCSKEQLKEKVARAAEQRRLDSERCQTAQQPAVGGGKATRSSGGAEGGGDWQCSMCTFFNGPGATRCDMCSTPRDRGGADGESTGSEGTVGRGGGGSSGSVSAGLKKQGVRGGPAETHVGTDSGKLPGGGGGKGPLTAQSVGTKTAVPRTAGSSMGPVSRGDAGRGRDPSGAAFGATVKGPSDPTGSESANRIKRTRVDTSEMDWPCSMCTLLNPASANKCSLCEAPRGPPGPVVDRKPVLPIQARQDMVTAPRRAAADVIDLTSDSP